MENGKWIEGALAFHIPFAIFRLPWRARHGTDYFFFGAPAPLAAPAAGAAPFAAAAPLAAGAAAAPFAPLAAPAAGAATPAAPGTAPSAATSSFTGLASSSLRCATFGRPYTLLLSFHFS